MYTLTLNKQETPQRNMKIYVNCVLYSSPKVMSVFTTQSWPNQAVCAMESNGRLKDYLIS